jgi:hypothetical protein
MNIICGPEDDKRTVRINLPKGKSKIGVLISGGIDSAILYYVLLLENKLRNNPHDILPISIMRAEGSEYFSKLVVASINEKFKLPNTEAIIVGDPTLPDDQQVKSGVDDALDLGFNLVYAGVIEQQEEHMIGWVPPPSGETKRFKTPFKNINKTHIIELVTKFKQEDLFYITHTCNVYKVGRCHRCNGCNERAWGFQQLGLTDPGTI